MKTPFITIILSLLFLACENSPRGKINSVNISDTQHPETKVEFTATPALNQKSEILISSGQSSPFTTLQINGCNFDLVYDNGDTIYLATTDMKFRTTEGYKIGTKFTDLPKIIQNKLTKEPGWGYFFKLNSGWFLGFCEGESCTDYYPTGNSRVKWIFKRR
jgi:hypothetical protein